MSIWQLYAVLNGIARHNAPRDGKKLTEAEAVDLFDWIDSEPPAERTLTTPTYDWDEHGPVEAGIVTFTVR